MTNKIVDALLMKGFGRAERETRVVDEYVDATPLRIDLVYGLFHGTGISDIQRNGERVWRVFEGVLKCLEPVGRASCQDNTVALFGE
jgi:hypothetical protein